MTLYTKDPVRNLLHHPWKPFWNMKLVFWHWWPNTLEKLPHAWNKKYSSNQDKRLDVHNIGVHVHLFCVRMVASFMTRCTACMHAQERTHIMYIKMFLLTHWSFFILFIGSYFWTIYSPEAKNRLRKSVYFLTGLVTSFGLGKIFLHFLVFFLWWKNTSEKLP